MSKEVIAQLKLIMIIYTSGECDIDGFSQCKRFPQASLCAVQETTLWIFQFEPILTNYFDDILRFVLAFNWVNNYTKQQ